MWSVSYPSDPLNKDNNWDIVLHKFIFPLNYVKHHIKSTDKGSKADQYVVQNLTWPGLYPEITLENALLQKVPELVTLVATGPQVYVITMTTFLFDSYYDLYATLTHANSLKLKSFPGENVVDLFTVVLLDA